MSTALNSTRTVRKSFWLFAGILAGIAAGGVIGCNRSAKQPASAEAGKPSSPVASTATLPPNPPDLKKPIVQIDTTAGTITVQLDAVRAPGTVRNFLNYAGDGFYDSTLVHYVSPGKMIVAGGYATDKKIKPTRTPIRNEAHNGVKNVRGTIAMARDATQIDSATAQFFFNLADAPQRDHTGDTPANYGYCVFGEVTEGLNVADKIAQSPTADQGGDLAQTPNPPIVIKSVRVVR